MPATYEPITRVVVSGGSTNSINLSSFGGYTDLVMDCVGSLSGTSIGYFFIQFNNVTSSGNYGQIRLLAYSAGRLSDQASTQANFDATVGNTIAGSAKLIIPQYTDTNTYKYAQMWQTDSNGGSVNQQMDFFQSTSALTSIQLTTPSGLFFNNGFVVSLYGLLAA